MTDFSWHQSQWDYLAKRYAKAQFPHALLLQGVAGLGKYAFAHTLVKRLLCQAAGDWSQKPCGQCKACLLMAAQNNPDFLEVRPEEEGKGIRIDEIRELINWQTKTSHFGGKKVALIAQADKMNRNAANAILKTLEEPAGNTLLVLVTENPSYLPVTIRSRCQALKFRAPSAQEAKKYYEKHAVSDFDANLAVALAGRAPLRAVDLSEAKFLAQRQDTFEELLTLAENTGHLVNLAAKWEKIDQNQVYGWLQSWCMDMIRLKLCPGSSLIVNSDFRTGLNRITQRISIEDLYNWYDRLQEAKRLLATNVSKQLQLEFTLIKWQQSFIHSL